MTTNSWEEYINFENKVFIEAEFSEPMTLLPTRVLLSERSKLLQEIEEKINKLDEFAHRTIAGERKPMVSLEEIQSLINSMK